VRGSPAVAVADAAEVDIAIAPGFGMV